MLEPTPAMVAFYEQRTNEHSARIQRCLAVMASVTDFADELTVRAQVHDASKFGPEERIPYIWLTSSSSSKSSAFAPNRILSMTLYVVPSLSRKLA